MSSSAFSVAFFIATIWLEKKLAVVSRTACVQAGGHVAREERLEEGAGVGLEQELVARDALDVLGGHDREQLLHDRLLDEGGHEPGVDDVHAVVDAGDEVVGDEARDRQDVGERRALAEALEVARRSGRGRGASRRGPCGRRGPP